MKHKEKEGQGLFLGVSETVWEGMMKVMRGLAGSSPDKEAPMPEKFGISSMRADVKALLGALEENMASFGKTKKRPQNDGKD